MKEKMKSKRNNDLKFYVLFNFLFFRSMESPSNSSEHVNESLSSIRSQHNIANSDPDLDVDELPPLKLVLGEDVLKKLKPKEKKRQEVINGVIIYKC